MTDDCQAIRDGRLTRGFPMLFYLGAKAIESSESHA
jgi:hypothetical protein